MRWASFAHVLHVGRHIFVRDFKLRYRRAFFGVLWAIIPLAIAGATVAYAGASLGMDQGEGPVPYPLRVFLGIVVMQVFVDALQYPQQLARRFRTILLRVPFPRNGLLVASMGFVGFNLVIRLLFVAGLFAWFGVTPAPTAPLALLGALCLGLAGLALGALIAPVSLLLWDVRYGLPYLNGLLYLVTPVFYPLASDGALATINRANPLTYLVLSTRDLAFSAPADGWPIALGIALAVLPLTWASVAYYRRAMLRVSPHI